MKDLVHIFELEELLQEANNDLVRRAKEEFTGKLIQQGWRPSEAEKKAREIAKKHDQRSRG